MPQQEVHTHTFANGLTLVAERMPHVRSAAVSFLTPGGCAYDPPAMLGLAAITADLLLRGAGERDSRALTTALDNLGIDYSTGVRGLNLQIGGATLARNLPEALKLFADILRRPHLPEEHLDPAKQLALQDLYGLEDSPQQKVMIELRRRYYPVPLNRDHFGTEEGVENCTSEAVRDHYRRLVRPMGTIIAVAGNVEWEPLRDQIEDLFGDWDGGEPRPESFGPNRPVVEHLPKETTQTQIALAWPSVPMTAPGYYPARMAEAVLSGGMAARLFTEVREKRGLCYTVAAAYESSRDRGTMLCYSGTSTDRAQQTLDVILDELDRLGEGVTDEEMDRARAGVKSSIIMRQESTSHRAATLTSDWYHFGRVRPTEEIQQAFDRITAAEVVEHVQAHPAHHVALLTLGEAPLSMAR